MFLQYLQFRYFNLLFIDPDVFLGAILPDLSKWFNTSDVEYKREDIANLIKEVASKDNNKRKVKFPKIQLPSREEKEEERKKTPGMYISPGWKIEIIGKNSCLSV